MAAGTQRIFLPSAQFAKREKPRTTVAGPAQRVPKFQSFWTRLLLFICSQRVAFIK